MFSSTWERSWSGRAYSNAPSRDRPAPTFVVMTSSSGYGCSAVLISSLTERVGRK